MHDLNQGRVQWRVLINSEVNLRFPKMAVNSGPAERLS
jgi:hypothetical protein